jgi:hypothetical protein
MALAGECAGAKTVHKVVMLRPVGHGKQGSWSANLLVLLLATSTAAAAAGKHTSRQTLHTASRCCC